MFFVPLLLDNEKKKDLRKLLSLKLLTLWGRLKFDITGLNYGGPWCTKLIRGTYHYCTKNPNVNVISGFNVKVFICVQNTYEGKSESQILAAQLGRTFETTSPCQSRCHISNLFGFNG